MPNYEYAIMDKVAFLTGEQQERVLRFIEDIEAKEPRMSLMLYYRMEPFNQYIQGKYLGKTFMVNIGEIGDLENLLVNYFRENHHLLIGRPTAQKVIYEIGSIIPLTPERTFMVKGRNLDTGLPASIEISSIEVREQIQPPIDKVFRYIEQHLKFYVQHQGVPEDVFTNAILRLSGNYAYDIKGVAEAVQKSTGLIVID